MGGDKKPTLLKVLKKRLLVGARRRKLSGLWRYAVHSSCTRVAPPAATIAGGCIYTYGNGCDQKLISAYCERSRVDLC